MRMLIDQIHVDLWFERHALLVYSEIWYTQSIADRIDQIDSELTKLGVYNCKALESCCKEMIRCLHIR